MRVFIALAVLLAGLSLPGCPKSAARPDTPDGIDLHPAVSTIADISDPDLSAFYAAFADVLERDHEIVQTTGQLRTAYMRAGRLAFQQTGTKGRHPLLADEIDAILAESLGLDDVPLTEERREKAVACFRAIAQALQ